jgi:hypothetical protein
LSWVHRAKQWQRALLSRALQEMVALLKTLLQLQQGEYLSDPLAVRVLCPFDCACACMHVDKLSAVCRSAGCVSWVFIASTLTDASQYGCVRAAIIDTFHCTFSLHGKVDYQAGWSKWCLVCWLTNKVQPHTMLAVVLDQFII